MAIREEELAKLLEKANTLPLCPGVYVMKGRDGGVVYVGKSRKLKNRVSQYFHNGEKNIKTERMVASVCDFDYYVCATEIEALTLENTLIKRYTPKYNIRLKDAKSYPYIKITDGEYPTLLMTRRRENDKGRYFGPYSGVSTVYSVIGTLQRTLGLPNCKRRFPRDIGAERPCIYHQMKRCCGVCTGQISPEEYAGLIRTAADILRGNISGAKRALTEEMMRASDEERYEAAARCRDTIAALERLRSKQHMVESPDTEEDVVGLYTDEFGSCVSVFCIRAGVVADTDRFPFGRDVIVDEGTVVSFLCDYYAKREYIPKTVLLSFEPEEEDRELLAAFLSGKAGRKTEVRTPERGASRALCETVRANAEEAVRLARKQAEKDDGVLTRLCELLGLESYPSRIEAYDISNYGEEHLTAGMVVCEDGRMKKSDYRYFRIGSVEGTDDYGSMREALSRRLAHLSDEEGSFSHRPDLILLDGGMNHVAVVRQVLQEMHEDIPVFGMVKDNYHKTRALCTDSEEISIARENAVYVLLYKLQEEVHRFTISRMQAAKRKTLRTSSLTVIPGIGPAKAKRLLDAFGGAGALREASEEAIAGVDGISARDAKAVYAHFRGTEKK